MRVIAGKYKGRKLSFPENKATRPTADMVKEAIFAKLFDRVQNAVFLDAFCGSGQMGIEALSRGAKKALFVDEGFFATSVVKQNLAQLKIEEETVVLCLPILKALKKINEKLDIVFLDPPYAYKEYEEFFQTLKDNNLLSENAIIVCEHSRDIELNFDGFVKTSIKSYGIKSISYFEVK